MVMILINLRKVIREICEEYDDQLTQLLSTKKECRRAESNLLRRTIDMDEFELKEVAAIRVWLKFKETVKWEMKGFKLEMISGLDKDQMRREKLKNKI